MFLSLLLLGSLSVFANESGYEFYNQFLGHVYKKADLNSSSLTTIQCGQKLKILSPGKHWKRVQVAGQKGYIRSSQISVSRPNCFQSEFNDYYHSLDFDITDMHYFGRLNDVFVKGKSRLK